MKNPQFNNTPNILHKSINGQKVWDSRSVAVMVLYFVVKINPTTGLKHTWVALGRRGRVVTETNRWSLPGGFLDWGEKLEDCGRREAWEELGLIIPKDKLKLWTVSDSLMQNQVITFFYHFTKNLAWSTKLPKIVVDGKETIDGKWVEISQLDNFDICFNHDNRINEFLGIYEQGFVLDHY